jgi:putative beta-barrel porin BBP2
MNFAQRQQRSLILIALTLIVSGGQIMGGEPASIEGGKEKPYKFDYTLSLSGGYDSNPTSLADDFPLPAGLEQKESAYIEGEAAVKFTYDFAKKWNKKDETDELVLSYDFIADVYTDISGNDGDIHTFAGSYERSLWSVVSGKLQLIDKFVRAEGDSVDNVFQVSPSLRFVDSKICPLMDSFAVVYAFQTVKFFQAGASTHDQERHTLKAIQVFALMPKFETEFDLTYAHYWNNANGPDFDHAQNAIEAEFSTKFGPKPDAGQSEPFGHKLTLDVLFKYHFDRYTNLNSQTTFTRKRSDDTTGVTVTLSYKLCENMTLNASYAYFQDASNIPVYHYHDHNILAGLSVNF